MRLSVHVHTLQHLRDWGGGDLPDPVSSVAALDIAGAEGIVYRYTDIVNKQHEKDLKLLKSMVKSHLSVEIEPKEDLVRKVLDIQPDEVTFIRVGDHGENTGIDAAGESAELEQLAGVLKSGGIEVNLLIDPDITQVKAARAIQADFVNINVASYTKAKSAQDAIIYLEEIETVALGASKLGLRVIVSNGVTHRNAGPVAEFNIIEEAVLGHEIFARALFIGMDKALQEVRETTRWKNNRS